MKKIILFLIILFIYTSPTLALEATPGARQNRIEKRQEIKDQRKANLVEKINKKLAELNQKATEAFDQHLNSIQNLLNKVINWKNKAKTNNKDVSIAETAIEAAQTAIDEAKIANEAQKLKVYIIEFTDESGLKIGASAAKTNLKNDLKTVREKIKTARQKLVEAIKTVKLL